MAAREGGIAEKRGDWEIRKLGDWETGKRLKLADSQCPSSLIAIIKHGFMHGKEVLKGHFLVNLGA